MPFSKGSRQALRCLNAECPSVKRSGPNGGRVLLESVGSVHFKEAGGDKLAMIGTWLYAECGTCHQRRYNPDVVAFDGMGVAIERTLQAVAQRADEQAAADDADRRSLRCPAA